MAPNMDTLVALGSSVSFVYSVFKIFSSEPDALLHGLYFESAAMILVLISFGKLLEARAKGKTTDALKSLEKLTPESVTVIRNGAQETINVSSLCAGDVFVLRPGERVAADGIILSGESSVDESSLTGESLPVDKGEGAKVSAGTVNLSGYIECKAEKVGEDTAISKIIAAVTDACATKAPIAKIADKVAGIFVPTVICIALATLFIWLSVGTEVYRAIGYAISVLVISCPCALGLATPVAIMVGSGVGAKNGILYKSAQALELSGRIKTVVFDKTGTITEGKPSVTDVYKTSEDLLSVAYALEYKSEHPLAKAINEYCEKNGVELLPSQEFKVHFGKGVSAKIGDELMLGGSKSFIENEVNLSQDEENSCIAFANEGKTPILFAKNGKLLGIIAVADTVKSDSKKTVQALKKMNIRCVMLTGDNEITAKAIAKSVGIEQVVSGALPDKKADVIKQLCKDSKTAMVGDGINDALALSVADLGIAVGAGTDIAIESADVVLMGSSTQDVAKAIMLGKKCLSNIKQNLFWAFFYNALCIPLAAGVFSFANVTLNPMIGAAAMSLSSFCVVSNALRLNLFKYNLSGKENRKMITVKVKGMMCPHCEAAVSSAVSAIKGVTNVKADHKNGTVEFEAEDGFSIEVVKKTITGKGYEVIE